MEKKTDKPLRFTLLPGMKIRFKEENETDNRNSWLCHCSSDDKTRLVSTDGKDTITVPSDRIIPDTDIFEYATTLVAKTGCKYKIDLVEKTFKLDGDTFISSEGTVLPLPEKKTMAEAIITIEELYRRFKHSVPSEKDMKSRSRFFRALNEDELSDDDMMYGDRRHIARLYLELYVLVSLLNGSLTWNDTIFGNKSWFWQSTNDRDLVLLKQWFPKH